MKRVKTKSNTVITLRMTLIKNFIWELLFRCFTYFLPTRKASHVSSDLGITTLLCHRDVTMFIYALHSLFYQLGFTLSIFIVNDGSLTEQDKKRLHSFFTAKILEPKTADARMQKLLKPYPEISSHRFAGNIGHFKLKFDALFLCPFKRFIFMDADLLFLNRPTEVMNWIHNKELTNFYTAHRENFFTKKYYPEFTIRKLLYKYLRIKMSAGFSSGLFLIADKKILNLKSLNNVFKVYKSIFALLNVSLEESALSVLCASPKFKCLPLDQYAVFSLWPEYERSRAHFKNLTMAHFGWETKHQFKRHALKLAISTHFFRNPMVK